MVPKKRTPKIKIKKKIVKGDEAVIYRLPNESPKKMIMRKTHASMNLKSEHPKIKFYGNAIEKILFPGNTINISMVKVPKDWRPHFVESINLRTYPKGIEYYSEKIPISRPHRKYRKAFYNEKTNKKEEKLIERHEKKMRKHIGNSTGKIKKTIDEMYKAGFDVNKHPANIDLIKGTPVFFETQILYPEKLEKYIQQKPLSKTFTREKKGRALRLIKRLKTIWKSVE